MQYKFSKYISLYTNGRISGDDFVEIKCHWYKETKQKSWSYIYKDEILGNLFLDPHKIPNGCYSRNEFLEYNCKWDRVTLPLVESLSEWEI